MAPTPRSRTVALTLAVALLTLLGVSAAPTAQADDPTVSAAVEAPAPAVIPFVVPEGALFTRPPDAGGTHEEEIAWNLLIQHLLDATPAGATVTGSLFSLTATDSQAALKRADERGVKVRLLLYDRRADDKQVRSLVRSLNDGKTRGSWAKVCYGSCYGHPKVKKKGKKKVKPINPGVQHFKAFTFSTVMETDTQAATNVWTAGSGNLTNGGSGFNSYVTKKNGPGIVAALNTYMVGMRADKEARPGVARIVEEGIYKMYLYPQRGLTPDVVSDTLKTVTCAAPAGYGLNGKTVVRVGMFTWTPFRKLDLQLVRLRQAGCDVQVEVSAPTIDKLVMKHLIRGGVPVFNAHHYTDQEFYYLHDKNLIIDGAVNGVPTSEVLAGSNNFTDGGLIRNTESIIQIRDRAVTNEFLTNWALIQGYTKPITKLSQLSAKAVPTLDPDNMEPTGR